VESRDVLIVEVSAAFGILGLLLVFLPLFLDAVRQAEERASSLQEVRARILRSWLVPVTIGIAAGDATLGLLTLWGTCNLAVLTAVLLMAVTWSVVVLGVVAVASVG
jgi:hypothetical protein